MRARLIARNLLAHKVRTALTLLTLVVAVFLLCFLRSVLVALGAGVEAASSRRLQVQSAVSLFVDLPLAYQAKIDAVPGVERTCKFQWFGGIYREPSNFFAQFAVDPRRWFECYPEVEVFEGSRDKFLAGRTTCLVGQSLARRFGWKTGDRIPLQGTIFPRKDGAAWQFQVAGIYRSKNAGVDEGAMFFHYAYLLEGMESGAVDTPPGVGVYTVRLAPGAGATAVMSRIDALFERGPQRVQTTTEAEFNRQFVTMLGNVPALLGAIGFGVLFAISLAALNTMLMAGRERTHDIGIMKALGFTSGGVAWLLLAESLLLCGGGGLLGVLLAKGIEPLAARGLSSVVPGFVIAPATMGLGLGAALAIGLLAGAAPAILAGRLAPVVALRAEG